MEYLLLLSLIGVLLASVWLAPLLCYALLRRWLKRVASEVHEILYKT